MLPLASRAGQSAAAPLPPTFARSQFVALGAGDDDNVSVRSFNLADVRPRQGPFVYALNVGGANIDVSSALLERMPVGNELAATIRAYAPSVGLGERLFTDRDPAIFRRILNFYLNAGRLPDGIEDCDVSALRMEAERFRLFDLVLECDQFYPLRQRAYRAQNARQFEARATALQQLAAALRRYGRGVEASRVAQQAAQLHAALVANAAAFRPAGALPQPPAAYPNALLRTTGAAPAGAAQPRQNTYLGWEPPPLARWQTSSLAPQDPPTPAGALPIPGGGSGLGQPTSSGLRPLSYGTDSTSITETSLPLTPSCACCGPQAQSFATNAAPGGWTFGNLTNTKAPPAGPAAWGEPGRAGYAADASLPQGTPPPKKLFLAVNELPPPPAPTMAFRPTPEVALEPPRAPQPGVALPFGVQRAGDAPYLPLSGDVSQGMQAPRSPGATRPPISPGRGIGPVRGRKSHLVSFINTNVRRRPSASAAAPRPAAAPLTRQGSAENIGLLGVKYDRIVGWTQQVSQAAAAVDRPASVTPSQPLDVARSVASAGWSRPASPGLPASEPSEPWFSPTFLQASLREDTVRAEAQTMQVD